MRNNLFLLVILCSWRTYLLAEEDAASFACIVLLLLLGEVFTSVPFDCLPVRFYFFFFFHVHHLIAILLIAPISQICTFLLFLGRFFSFFIWYVFFFLHNSVTKCFDCEPGNRFVFTIPDSKMVHANKQKPKTEQGQHENRK